MIGQSSICLILKMSHFHLHVLSDKMPRRVRVGKHISESSPSLLWQQGRGQQGWYTSGTVGKQFTKPTPRGILSPVVHFLFQA